MKLQPNTSSVSTQDRARSLMTAHKRALKNRQQAMLKRSAEEIGFTEHNG